MGVVPELREESRPKVLVGREFHSTEFYLHASRSTTTLLPIELIDLSLHTEIINQNKKNMSVVKTISSSNRRANGGSRATSILDVLRTRRADRYKSQSSRIDLSSQVRSFAPGVSND
jgi:propanediol dehydratase large subunit